MKVRHVLDLARRADRLGLWAWTLCGIFRRKSALEGGEIDCGVCEARAVGELKGNVGGSGRA